MDRRDFLKILGIAPAVAVVPKADADDVEWKDVETVVDRAANKEIRYVHRFVSTGEVTRNSVPNKPDGIYINNVRYSDCIKSRDGLVPLSTDGSSAEFTMNMEYLKMLDFPVREPLLLPSRQIAELTLELNHYESELARILATGEKCQVDIVYESYAHYEFVAVIEESIAL